MSITFDKIKAITEIQATSGFERPMQDFMRQNITPHVDEVQTDGLGGIFGIKHAADANAPRIMVAGHMDEVGFMVSKIKPDGTLLVVDVSQAEVELIALRTVREYGLRAMDAWQLACAHLTFEALAEPHEQAAFVTRDAEQARVAREWGYLLI